MYSSSITAAPLASLSHGVRLASIMGANLTPTGPDPTSSYELEQLLHDPRGPYHDPRRIAMNRRQLAHH